jgi:two-component system, NtrC family, sensor histidine kinase AtoS
MSATAIEIADKKDLTLLHLEEAFKRFNETGERLEARYQALLQETENLRLQLAEKEKEVKRSEKLATLGETAAAIAHEVRNPLGAITLFLSLLRRDVENMPSAIKLVDQIDKSIVSLNDVVENILQFSRDRVATRAPLNIHTLVTEQIAVCQHNCQKPAVLECHLSGNPLMIGNEIGLKQIVHNLLINALQATRFEGHVQVNVSDEEDEIIKIEVNDNGPGIPESLIGTIFDPFVTTKNEGTGLGLAIVRQLAEQHQGSVSVANKNGAHFTVRIPRNGR